MKTAIYTHLTGGIAIRIPKRRGQGYLKSVIGFHGVNEVSAHLTDNFDYLGLDVCDIDGYLSVSLSISRWHDDYPKAVDQLKKILSEALPHVKAWEELSVNDFFETLK